MDSMGGALGPVLAWGLGDLAFLVCWVSRLGFPGLLGLALGWGWGGSVWGLGSLSLGGPYQNHDAALGLGNPEQRCAQRALAVQHCRALTRAQQKAHVRLTRWPRGDRPPQELARSHLVHPMPLFAMPLSTKSSIMIAQT